MAETLRTAAPVPGNGQFAGQDAITNVATTAHGAVDKAANTVKPAVDRAASLAHGAVDKAASAAVPAAAWVQEKAEAAHAAQKRAVESSADYISGNPFKAIGIAALIGFLIGRLTF